MSISLIVSGALGRMGQAITELALNDERFLMSGALISPHSTKELPTHWHFPIASNLDHFAQVKPHTVLIDFSHFTNLEAVLHFALEHHIALLVGSTAHPSSHTTLLSRAAERIPILVAPNTSIMANLMIEFSHLAAASLERFEAHILDIHHRNKKDAPSGTALAIKQAINSVKDGPKTEPAISSVRIGEVKGEHTVRFFKENESLAITHSVADRRVFAEGALFAALFLSQQVPGLYDMADVLNLNMTIENRP